MIHNSTMWQLNVCKWDSDYPKKMEDDTLIDELGYWMNEEPKTKSLTLKRHATHYSSFSLYKTLHNNLLKQCDFSDKLLFFMLSAVHKHTQEEIKSSTLYQIK